MQQPVDRRSLPGTNKPQPARFARLSPRDSNTADLMHGCAVVTPHGERIGAVDHLMIDVASQQLRYVMLQQASDGALIAIPWHALYFDASLDRLVFYSCGAGQAL